MDSIPVKLQSVFLRTLAVFFFAELFVTFLLELAPHGLWRNFADPLLVVLVAAPAIYFWVVKEETEKAARAEYAGRQINSIISRIWNISLRSTEKEELLRRILEIILENSLIALKKKAAIFLTEKGRLVMKAQIGFSEAQASRCGTVEPGSCLCGKALETGKMIFRSGVDADHQTTYEGMAPHGHYCVPIRTEEQLIGVLTLYTETSLKPDPGYEQFLGSGAAIIGRIVEYKDLEHSLAQMQRLDSLGRLAGAVAHDFNNILTSITGFSALALEEAEKGTPAYLYFSKIGEAAGKGAGLTKQLLAFARREPLRREKVELNSVIRSMAGVVEGLFPKNIALKLELSPEPLNIMGSRSQLEQVVMNLAVNARDAMPAGGLLLVKSSRVNCVGEKGCLSKLHDCEYAASLFFEDTGAGMSEAVMLRVFEPFFTTKAPEKGTGLGLSTVHGIVKQHKGVINVSSRLGKGSVFQICLPLAGKE
jgi:signal transduction histidine kinase